MIVRRKVTRRRVRDLVNARLAAGICVGTALLSAFVGAVLAFATGRFDIALTNVGIVITLALSVQLARISERLDALQAPRRRCDWCDELFTDDLDHLIRCSGRNAQED